MMHCGRSALAAIGIFGVISYSVSRRTTEVGIRVALGAQSADVLKQVLTEGARLVAIGLPFGLAVSAILASVTLVACYIPARRAMRVDPIVALR
jgi:putative ABC transport system permease protein